MRRWIGERALVVALGVLIALFLVWLGAQAAPDDIYFPIKFVTNDLPT